MSIIYIVQRIRPDLVRKQEPTRQEVYDTPSIHSVSVVDTLSGMFVTEPGLSPSHLDPIEVGSYQRFDSFRREESRATFLEPVHGRVANQTEIEAVYRQAVDNLSNISGVTGHHHRDGSDTSGNPNVNVPVQSRSESMFSGSIQSLSETPTVNVVSSSGLQILSGETKDLPKERESCDTLGDPNSGALPHRVDEGGIDISGDGMILEEGEQQENVTVTTSSPAIDIQTTLEAKGIEKVDIELSDLFIKPQSTQVAGENNETVSPEPLIVDNRDIELDIELVKLPPPPEIHRKRKADPLDIVSSDVAVISSTEGLGVDVMLKTDGVDSDVDTIQDRDQSARTPFFEAISLESEECANGLLELVRIPPPPSVPRTGQLVALESEESEDWGNTCVSELTSDAEQDNQYDKEAAADDNSCCEAFSTTQRKERLHLAIIDQLTLLSERLEAVAARQIQKEEHGDGDEPDQRPPFSPALQSLPLTPLYSANHSVPLTPACAWSSCLNTPAPTPRQTPRSAFLTTAPTPIHTLHTPAQGVSGICSPNDVSMANPSRSNVYETGQVNPNDSNNWNDEMGVCSPSPSQETVSRQRSRCSSFSEVGQEFVLNEWSVRDLHGTTEAFSSKQSSGTNSLVSNSDRSIADLNSVSEPIDIVEFTMNEGHKGHMNSPETHSPNQQVDAAVDMFLPQKPCLNYENTDVYSQNLLQQSHLNSILTELETDQIDNSCKMETSNVPPQFAQGVLQEELFNSEMSLAAHTCQQLNTTDPKENENETVGSTVQKPDTIGDNCEPESAGILKPEVISNALMTSELPQKIEFKADSSDIHMQETRFDPSPLDSEFTPFLESDQKELAEFSQYNPFEQSSQRLLDGSENPFKIPSGLDSLGGQPLSYQSKEFTTGEEQYIIEETQAFSSQSTSLTHFSSELNSSPQTTDSHYETYCAENLTDQQVVVKQNTFTEETFHRLPEEPRIGVTEETFTTSHSVVKQNTFTEETFHSLPEEPRIGVMEETFTTSHSTKQETNQEPISRTQWTMFSQSEEGLIFEMGTESESSSGNSAKRECKSASTSRETKAGNDDRCTADQESLFPPLQIFSDVADMITGMNAQGITLPPPPKQPHRKQADKSVSVTTEQSLPREIGGKDSTSRQKSVVDKRVVAETRLVSALEIDHEHHGILKLKENGNIETHLLPNDKDLSGTSNSVSETELDLLSESKLDGLPQKLRDNSICGIVCQELELSNHEDEMFAGENFDDSNKDGEIGKSSIHDDIAPLLVPNNGTRQYVNLGDLPEDCLVLRKRSSTTSSTDDSSTSTDSSLSENEMPYSKLHEDAPAER